MHRGVLEQFVYEGFASAAGRKSVHVRLMIAVGELGGNSEHSELLLTLHRLPLRIGYDRSVVEQCFYSVVSWGVEVNKHTQMRTDTNT